MTDTATAWGKIEGKWNEAKGRVKSQWGKLTDDEIAKTEGNRDKLLGAIQQKYGIGRDKAEEQVASWTASADSWLTMAKEQVAETVEKGKEYIATHNPMDMAADVRELVKRYPLQAALLGIGVGYLVGRMLSSGSRA